MVQDAYSLRCMPQVHGATRDAIAYVESIISTELNSANDNPLLYEAIRAIAPEWWDETRITLNKDVVAKRHRDGNKGHSWMIWLGDYEGGGELHFDDGRVISGKEMRHKFEGQVPRWKVPHYGGTKYSVIMFRSTGPSKASRLTAKRLWLAEQHAGPVAVEER